MRLLKEDLNMEQKLLKDVKKGEFFTKKPIEEPKETQVFIRGDYERSEKKYEVSRFSDFCNTAYLSTSALARAISAATEATSNFLERITESSITSARRVKNARGLANRGIFRRR